MVMRATLRSGKYEQCSRSSTCRISARSPSILMAQNSSHVCSGNSKMLSGRFLSGCISSALTPISSAGFTSGYLDTFCSSQDGVAGECLQIGDQVGEARLERPGGGAERGELESAVRLQQPLRRARLREHEQLPAARAE